MLLQVVHARMVRLAPVHEWRPPQRLHAVICTTGIVQTCADNHACTPALAAIYETATWLNHSCRPTAAYHFRKGGRIVVRTLTEVAAGAEVTVSYLDCLLPLHR